MWHALRAELAYFRPWLLGGLGIAAGVVIIVSVVFFAVGEEGPPSHAAAGIRGMFLIMAPMIVGFIAQTFRSEERRARLLLAGPLTPRQLAGVMVLLPVVLFGIAVLAAGLVIGAGSLVTGKLELESLNIVGYVGGMMFMMMMMGLLAQEATAARRQRRLRAAAAGWAGFVVAVLLFAALSVAALYLAAPQGFVTWTHLNLGNLIVAVTAMVAFAALYAGRTDFTR
jgi:hypothetical protein